MVFQSGGQHFGRSEAQALLSHNLLFYEELRLHKVRSGLSLAVPPRAPYLLAGLLAVLLGTFLTLRLGSRLGAIIVSGGILLEAIEFRSILAEVAELDPSSVLEINEAFLDSFEKEHAEEGQQVRRVYERDLAALHGGEVWDEDAVIEVDPDEGNAAAGDARDQGGTAT